jgi:hypothetical protein
MNRRSFLTQTTAGMAGAFAKRKRDSAQPQEIAGNSPHLQTQHVILVVNGNGARKKDYYENASVAPQISQLAAEGFVFEEDHCDTVTSHRACFAELVHGLPNFQCISDSLRVPEIMWKSRPALLIFRETRHDRGHGAGGYPRSVAGYDEYLAVVKQTDLAIGRIADWVKNDPYFREKTAIVIRPEFGRDDEINAFGELHHSPGFYYAHRVASIYWGPDFNKGVDRKTIINRRDMAPTLAKLMGIKLDYPMGRVVPGLFKA